MNRDRVLHSCTLTIPSMAWQAWGNAGIIFANGEEQATNRRLSNPAFFRADLLGVTHAIVLDLSECGFWVLFVLRSRVFIFKGGVRVHSGSRCFRSWSG